MGADEWPTTRPLIDLLEFEPYRFEFDQAIRLIEMLIEPEASLAEGPDPSREAVRLRSEMEFSFPPSVVRGLRLVRNRYGVLKRGEMVAALFGLAGVLGPLPLAFTDMLMDRRAKRDNAMRDFLDLFNHRLLAIFHRIRERAQIRLQWRHPIEQPVARMLFCIAGLGTDGTRNRLGRSGVRALADATGLARRGGRGGGRGGAGAGSQILGLGPDESGSGGARGFGGERGSLPGFGGPGGDDEPWSEDGGFYTNGLGGSEGQTGGGDYGYETVGGDYKSRGGPGYRSKPGDFDWKPGDGGDGDGDGDWDVKPEGVPDSALLFYALHFGSRPSSTSGLETMLTDFFSVKTSVKAFKGKWFDLDRSERTAIGALGRGTNQALGHTASLGSRAYDAGGGFDLEVQPKSQEMLDDFLPGGRAHVALARMTRMYVGPGPEFGVIIKATLPGRKVMGLSLKNNLRLGWTSRVCDNDDLTYDPNAVTETLIKIQAVDA